MDQQSLPLWILDTYPGFESVEYKNSCLELKKLSRELMDQLKKSPQKLSPEKEILTLLDLINRTGDLYENLESYVYCSYSTDTADSVSRKELNAIEALALPLKQAEVLFRNRLAELPDIETLIKTPLLSGYAFFLKEEIELQKHQLSPAEEELAADLQRSGGDAWGRLQETVSSNLSVPWDADGETEKTVIELRAMAFDADPSVRKKAYTRELSAWKSVEIPLAAALNGVKGFSHTLNSRQGYSTTLEKSALQSRLSVKALDSMIGVMTDSMPIFRSYFKGKARLLGKKSLPWYDLFAPAVTNGSEWSYKKCREFIIDKFGTLSNEYAEFARTAFDEHWIDARPRKGKVGGAYCISMPLVKQSRILCNFDGSFSGVTTVAHELGHGWHHEVLKEESSINRKYPMPLAETASIFSETLVFNATLAETTKENRLALLENNLADSSQVIVDILSRYQFEQAVMARRADSELSPREFSDLMIQAQKATYGDGLDSEALHPYMWAVKGHYYSPSLAFYNFPYAFGLLFGLGLYSLYEQDPVGFEPKYRAILMNTGRDSAVNIGKQAGFDLEKSEFWQSGIDIIERRVHEFINLID